MYIPRQIVAVIMVTIPTGVNISRDLDTMEAFINNKAARYGETKQNIPQVPTWFIHSFILDVSLTH